MASVVMDGLLIWSNQVVGLFVVPLHTDLDLVGDFLVCPCGYSISYNVFSEHSGHKQLSSFSCHEPLEQLARLSWENVILEGLEQFADTNV